MKLYFDISFRLSSESFTWKPSSLGAKYNFLKGFIYYFEWLWFKFRIDVRERYPATIAKPPRACPRQPSCPKRGAGACGETQGIPGSRSSFGEGCLCECHTND